MNSSDLEGEAWRTNETVSAEQKKDIALAANTTAVLIHRSADQHMM